MRHLEIKHLRMIAAIAETGNMTKAAARLFLSQSALSQQLKDIEDKLQAALFFRTRKVMLLTPVGRKLLESAKQVIQTLEDAELEIARTVSGEQGELKVGVQCVFCYKWLPGAVRVFQQKFPNIEFEVGTCRDLAADLASKKFDFVITAAAEPDDQHASQPLFADQLVCIMAADHPLRTRAFVRYEDFGDCNLISQPLLSAAPQAERDRAQTVHAGRPAPCYCRNGGLGLRARHPAALGTQWRSRNKLDHCPAHRQRRPAGDLVRRVPEKQPPPGISAGIYPHCQQDADGRPGEPITGNGLRLWASFTGNQKKYPFFSRRFGAAS